MEEPCLHAMNAVESAFFYSMPDEILKVKDGKDVGHKAQPTNKLLTMM